MGLVARCCGRKAVLLAGLASLLSSLLLMHVWHNRQATSKRHKICNVAPASSVRDLLHTFVDYLHEYLVRIQYWIIVSLSDGFGCSKPEWLISVRFNLNRLLGGHQWRSQPGSL